jgi:hypothetical protein
MLLMPPPRENWKAKENPFTKQVSQHPITTAWSPFGSLIYQAKYSRISEVEYRQLEWP